jgi:hypothetical protein
MGFSVTAGTAPFLFFGDHLLFVSRISGPIRPRSHPPESRKSRSHAGFQDGETRTRTGDTTIFSRAAFDLKLARFAGDFGPL